MDKNLVRLNSEIAKKLAATQQHIAEEVAKANAESHQLLALQIGSVSDNVKEIKTILKENFVTKDSFLPVQRIAYGLVALICGSVIIAILALIVNKK